MTERRMTGEECPETYLEATMDQCQPCPYFRGASSVTGRRGWLVLCNWPRNGSEIATPKPRVRQPVPAAFYYDIEES